MVEKNYKIPAVARSKYKQRLRLNQGVRTLLLIKKLRKTFLLAKIWLYVCTIRTPLDPPPFVELPVVTIVFIGCFCYKLLINTYMFAAIT